MNNFHSLDTSNIEKDSKHEKVVHKRRSSIFQSRVILFDECEENEATVDATDATKFASKMLDREEFNLQEYIISLRGERKQWIETLRQRRIERKSLAKQKLCLETQGQTLDLSFLTEKEKVFLAARPNYQHICKSYKKLSDVTVKISMLQNIVYKLNERFITQMEEQVHEVTDKIIKASGS